MYFHPVACISEALSEITNLYKLLFLPCSSMSAFHETYAVQQHGQSWYKRNTTALIIHELSLSTHHERFSLQPTKIRKQTCRCVIRNPNEVDQISTWGFKSCRRDASMRNWSTDDFWHQEIPFSFALLPLSMWKISAMQGFVHGCFSSNINFITSCVVFTQVDGSATQASGFKRAFRRLQKHQIESSVKNGPQGLSGVVPKGPAQFAELFVEIFVPPFTIVFFWKTHLAMEKKGSSFPPHFGKFFRCQPALGPPAQSTTYHLDTPSRHYPHPPRWFAYAVWFACRKALIELAAVMISIDLKITKNPKFSPSSWLESPTFFLRFRFWYPNFWFIVISSSSGIIINWFADVPSRGFPSSKKKLPWYSNKPLWSLELGCPSTARHSFQSTPSTLLEHHLQPLACSTDPTNLDAKRHSSQWQGETAAQATKGQKSSIKHCWFWKIRLEPPDLFTTNLNQELIQFFVEPTHLKNMRTSNWIISPRFGMKIKNIWNHHLVMYITTKNWATLQ